MTEEINETTSKKLPEYKGILSRLIPYFSGECNKENFRGAFWMFLLMSFLFLIGFIVILCLDFLLELDSVSFVYLAAFIITIGYVVKCFIPYVKVLAQRLHAFRMSYTLWVMLPSIICGGIQLMWGVDYFRMVIEEDYTTTWWQHALEMISLSYSFFIWGLCFFGSSKTADTKTIQFTPQQILVKKMKADNVSSIKLAKPKKVEQKSDLKWY